MLLGMVHTHAGDTAKAEHAYQQALAVNPRFVPAANNLAYLYLRRGGDKEKALELAQTAKEAAPDDPPSPIPSGASSTSTASTPAGTCADPRTRPGVRRPEVQYQPGDDAATARNKEAASGHSIERCD